MHVDGSEPRQIKGAGEVNCYSTGDTFQQWRPNSPCRTSAIRKQQTDNPTVTWCLAITACQIYFFEALNPLCRMTCTGMTGPEWESSKLQSPDPRAMSWLSADWPESWTSRSSTRGRTEVRNGKTDKPKKLILSHQAKQIFYSACPPGRNSCADQPCSLLCLPQPDQRHTCVCPDGAPTTTLPNGDLQCQCPSGYQLRNNTCVKTGEERATNKQTHTHSHTLTHKRRRRLLLWSFLCIISIE